MFKSEKRDIKRYGYPDITNICYICGKCIFTFSAWRDDKGTYHPECKEE